MTQEIPKPYSGILPDVETKILKDIYHTTVRRVLLQLQESGQITDFRQTRRNSPEFRRGIHYLVDTPNGQVPLAIASTKTERRKRLRSHPDIPVIHIRKRSKGKDLREIREDFSLRQNIIELSSLTNP